MKRVQIFQSKDEIVNLFFPMIVIGWMIWEAIHSRQYSSTETSWALFVARIVFLNFVHTLFSLTNLILVPEVKTWLKTSLRKCPTYWVTWLLMVLGSTLIVLNGKWGTSPYLYKASMALFVTINIHHVFSQMFGLSLLYNRNLSLTMALSKSEQLRVKRLEWLERIAFFGIVAPILVLVTIEQWAADHVLLGICSGISLFFAVSAIVLNLYWPRANQSNKTFFSLRYLILPFVRFSLAARVGYLSIHGLEYLFVTRQFWARTRLGGRIKRSGFWAGAAFVASTLIVVSPDKAILGFLLTDRWPGLSNWASAAAIVTTSLSIFHVFLDGALFRMRNTEVRENILPMLMREESVVIDSTNLIEFPIERGRGRPTVVSSSSGRHSPPS